jgi:hypothetical protein
MLGIMPHSAEKYLGYAKAIKRGIRRLLRRLAGPPDDPFAYVPAPKRPRLPHLSSAAVIDRPDK